MRFGRSGSSLGCLALVAIVVATRPAMAEATVESEPGNGITVTSSSSDTKVTFGGVIQGRFSLYKRDVYQPTGDAIAQFTAPFAVENVGVKEPSFKIHLFRMFAFGSLYKSWITYRVEIDAAANDQGLRHVYFPQYAFGPATPNFPQIDVKAGAEDQDGRTLKVMDAYIDFAPRPEARVRFGSMEVPYGRQEQVTDKLLQMTNRSVASLYFAPKRDRGVLFHGGTASQSIQYKIGAFNGTGIDVAQNTDAKLGYVARLQAASSGPYLNIESVVDQPSLFGVRGQGGFTWYQTTTTVKPQDPRFPWGDVRDNRYAADLELFFRRANLTMEYYTRNLEADPTNSVYPGVNLPQSCYGAYRQGRVSCDQTGFYVQGGVLVRDRHEISARISKVDFDRELDHDEQQEATVNYTYYFQRQNLKIGASLSYLRLGYNANGSSGFAMKTTVYSTVDLSNYFLDPTAFPGLEDDKNWLFVTQLQWSF